MTLKLRPRSDDSVPIELEGIAPDRLADQSVAEIERLPVYHGNRCEPLAELFDVTGSPADGCLVCEGNFAGVHWLGSGMRTGSIRVEGPAGRHLGSEMAGGDIEVFGNAGDWAGGEMKAGMIHVHGSAGHLVGAAYRGSRLGMTGGTILIDGDVGTEVGHAMRRGLLAIAGGCGDAVGFGMLAGTILVFGSAGIRPGAAMRRGTIGLFGDEPPELLPTFTKGRTVGPLILEILYAELRRLNFPIGNARLPRTVEMYHGDFLELGRGEILTRAVGETGSPIRHRTTV